MTLPDLIKHLRDLESKATSGEWKAEGDFLMHGEDEDADFSEIRTHPRDAQLIAAMRNNIGRLLDAVERLQVGDSAIATPCTTAHPRGPILSAISTKQ